MPIVAGFISKSPPVVRSWVYRFMLHGRSREMGLGSARVVGLAAGRAKASDARRLRLEGIDPIEQRGSTRAQAQLKPAKAPTFEKCANAYNDAHEAGGKRPKQAAQENSTL